MREVTPSVVVKVEECSRQIFQIKHKLERLNKKDSYEQRKLGYHLRRLQENVATVRF
ncbi:MAG: hypothetical protein Q8Q23_02270 [bacterium]|nr:hypothetical protein [bacterium]